MQRIAIIGAGGMGKTHGAAYAKTTNVEPVAVVDIDTDAAARLASCLGAQAFSDFDEMLEIARPDVIDVCVPTPSHKEYVLRAAAAGKHVVVEKPMARTLEDCREMADAAERAGVTLMVAQVLRFFPQFAMAKSMVDSGAVGNPAVVRLARGAGHPAAEWYGDFESSGGVILDLMVHEFDWLLQTFGPAERVFAKSLRGQGVENIDYALVTIRFKNGVIAHCAGSWAHPTSEFVQEFEIAGDAGMLDLSKSSSIAVSIGETRNESPMAEDPYYLELKHFIDCIEANTKPSITPEQSMQAVEVALGALESIQTGEPVLMRSK